MERGVKQGGATGTLTAVDMGTRLALASGIAAQIGLVRKGLALLRSGRRGGSGQPTAPRGLGPAGDGVVDRLGSATDVAGGMASGVQGEGQLAARGRAALAAHLGFGGRRASAGAREPMAAMRSLDGGMTNSAALQNRDRRTRLAEARVVAVQARPRGGGSTTVHWQGPVGLSPPARDGHDRRLAVTMVSVSEAAMLRSTAGAQGPVTRLAMAPDAVQLIGSTEPRGRLTADATGARGVVSTGDLTAMAGAAKPRTGHAAGFFGRAATPARPDGFGFGDSAARVANAPAATLLGPGSTRAAAGGPGSAGATGTAVGTGATAQSGAMSGDAGASPAGDGGQASTQASGGNGGHVQGDVYFDGALMGRWMSRALAREAARPPAGGAAFDARRNPLPTGRMIGG